MQYANYLALLAKYIVNALHKWDSKHLHYDSLRVAILQNMFSIPATCILNVAIAVILSSKHMRSKCPPAPSLIRPGNIVVFN